MTTETTFATQPSLKDIVANRVLDRVDDDGVVVTHERSFREWLERTGWEVRDRQVATTCLSTWIEHRVKARSGLFFINPETFVILIRETTRIPIEAPKWMTDFIMSFPNAPWARKLS